MFPLSLFLAFVAIFLSQEDIANLEREGSYSFDLDGHCITVDATDVDIISEDIPGWLVSNEGNLTVALEVDLTEDLKKEGMARELINRIQNLRKELGLEITDHINVQVAPYAEMSNAIADYGDMIKGQVLANSLEVTENDGIPTEFDEFTINIKIVKS